MNNILNSYFVKTHKLEISITIIAIALFLIYFLGAPHVFTRFPIYRAFMQSMPFFGIIAMLSLIISMRFSQGTINEYVCPSCKGVLFDIDRFKHVKKGKITKKSAKKHNTILQLLNDSSEPSELQCPSCSKDMNSVKVLYKIKHNSQAENFILKETIEDVVDSVMAGEKEMQVEGCKSCKSLWLDESNRLEISRGTIISNEKVLE